MEIKDSILIGEILIDEGLITPEQLDAGLKEQKKTGKFICQTLADMGFASEEKIFAVLSGKLGIPYVRVKDRTIEKAVIEKVPAKFASYYKLIPL